MASSIELVELLELGHFRRHLILDFLRPRNSLLTMKDLTKKFLGLLPA